MGMQISNVGAVDSKTVQKHNLQTQNSDNKPVDNQKEVASKSANSAIMSAGLALVTRSSGISSEDKSYIDGLKEKYLNNEENPKRKESTQKSFDILTSGSAREVSQRLGLLRQVQEQDENLSPMDFVMAQSDLKDLKSRGLDELTGKSEVEQLTQLSKARHLLGGGYSVDFVTEMVDLDATFAEYQHDLGMNEGAASASKDTKVSDVSKASEFSINDSADVKKLAGLAAQAYTPASKLKPERLGGYEVVGARTNDNGFSGTAFRGQDGNIVIAYRGSDDVNDIKSDLEMVNGTKLPEQFYDAQQFYEDIKAQNPESKVILTGHSLGGALSQLVAAHKDDTFAVAFNAPGTKDIIDRESGLSDSGNIYNVIVNGDKISGTLAQPGTTQLIEPKTDKYGQKLHPHAIGNCM